MPKAADSKISGGENQLLVGGASSLGIELSREQISTFIGYLELLKQWNRRVNLTGIRQPANIIRLHFLDSLAISTSLDPVGRMMDLGSGAGFPGIPIKIMWPGKEIYLIEARRKRSSFLFEVKRKLNLNGLNICTSRVEDIDSRAIGQFDEAVTRATVKPQEFLRLSGPLLRRGGRSLLMAGPSGSSHFNDEAVRKEASALGFKPSQIISYKVPLGMEKRSLLIYAKQE